PEFQVFHVMSSTGASILAAAYLLPPVYLWWSMRYGAKSGDNPWAATGLEWQTASPPPKGNFLERPVVQKAYAYDEPAPGSEPASGATA
ncbi:MAG TPA: hypothetical protein VFI81_07080, partial [Rhodanobacteraceae bacterium]|nr:hypothetical protein [Rhodanobacteraceae bacterium]